MANILGINPTIIESIGAKSKPDYDTKYEIDPKEHSIYDLNKRPRKKILETVYGPDGKPLIGPDGEVKKKVEYVDPTRLSISLQDIIVKRRVAFMNLGKIRLFAEPKNGGEERAFALLNKLRENNKASFKESEIARILNEELQVAKLYYSVDTEDASHWSQLSSVKKDFKMQILAPSKGDSLLPVFNSLGELVYFGRGYKRTPNIDEIMKGGGSEADADKEIECLDIYSKDKLYKFEKGEHVTGDLTEGGWVLTNVVNLPYGKIPVIYYSKDKPIWANVQPLIERLEVALSDLSDANSYNASPLLAFLNVTGVEAQKKGEQGKAVVLSGDKADVKYVTWDQVINAVEFEVNTLLNFIYSLTQTPNISFEEMKELGQLSGVAFDRIFLDAHLAARNEIEGGYGELIQRSINLEKALLASMEVSLRQALSDLSVTFEVPHFKLDDIDSDVDLAVKAFESGLISKATAMSLTGLVNNVEDELERMKLDEESI